MTAASVKAKQVKHDLFAWAGPIEDAQNKISEIIPMIETLESDHTDAIYHLRNMVTLMDKTESENVNFTLDKAKLFLQERGHL